MEKKPNLFIHTGTHKTGTTAIQRFLKANRKAFERKGFGIAGLTRSERAQIKQSADDIQENAKTTEGYDPIKESILRCKSKCRKRLHSFIISWEGFSGNNRSGYSNAKNYADFIGSYESEFNVKSITFFRRQDDFIESMYVQNVKQGYSETFDHYLEHIDPNGFNWLSITQAWETALGQDNVCIARYEKERFEDRTSILKQFINFLGLDPEPFNLFATNKPFSISNPGWPRHITEITRELNPSIPSERRDQYIRSVESLMHKSPNDQYSYLTPTNRKKLLLKFRNSNLTLAQERFGEQCQELFKGEDIFSSQALTSTSQPVHCANERDDLLKIILEMVLNFEHACKSTDAAQKKIQAKKSTPPAINYLKKIFNLRSQGS